ncbi:MAG: 3-phosphoshikimate 1-carboxyvinyltransferase [Acidobacteria bacterium]|nr:MAG: 3-phosphoshikimate 1-carboxyvinyltransferase [Acidobacteriota bacterium]
MVDRTIYNRHSRLQASVQVPGDKSLSHRAILWSGMAEGESKLVGIGPGADIQASLSAMRQLGVTIDGDKVVSPGISRWVSPGEDIDCANSGTTIRLLAGILSTATVQAVLTGDASLSARPMSRLVDPLRSLGGRIDTTPDGTAPLRLGGALKVVGASVFLDVASAQVRTAFEMAALAASGPSTLDSPGGFRDHTERMLVSIGLGEWASKTAFRITPGKLRPQRYDIPGDPSSASFLWALAAIHRDSKVLTPNVSLNPGRLGFLQILDEMGAGIEAVVTGSIGGDPVGDVIVRGAPLRAVSISGELVASALDELPLVAVVAAFAEGVTSVSDASELRTKESDRIEATTALIRALGGGVESRPDGFDVVGTGFLEGGTIESQGDHRIAMAGAIAALSADGAVTIRDAGIADVSWPDFYDIVESVW